MNRLAFLLALTLPGISVAADGVLEINQTCAVDTGCFPGDSAGFPVTINVRGSYQLTSNIQVISQTAIEVVAGADGATFDLNGFTIRGNTVCAGTPPVCSPSGGTGTGVRIVASRVRVTNGEISGMRSHGVNATGSDAQIESLRLSSNGGACISGGQGALIRNNTIRLCGAHGIVSGVGSLVLDNTVSFCGDEGIFLTLESAWGSNVLRGNNGGFGAPQAQGGTNLTPNVCSNRPCSSPTRRRYYLTSTLHRGSAVLSACADGFHTASLYELRDPSNLQYNAALGESADDIGSGPVAEVFGWARTGLDSSSFNCNAWTSNSVSGTQIALFPPSGFAFPEKFSANWQTILGSCFDAFKVWCVED